MQGASKTSVLGIDSAKVVHETIDGEVILIQLERGNYFSLSGSGREAWALLAEGRTPAEVCSTLRARYSGSEEEIERGVAGLVDQLVTEELVTAGAERPSGAEAPAAAPQATNGDLPPFEPPKLEKYTDMQDYLLIDPIHDVSESGWPSVKPPE